MKVLFLTTVLPGLRTMGSEVASQAVIDAMLELGCEVTTLGYMRRGRPGAMSPHEVSAGERVIETRNAGLQAFLWYGRAVLTRMPYSAAKYRSRSYTTRVRELLAANAYDAVIVDHAQLAWLATLLPPSQRLIGMVHNIENAMYRDLAQEPGRRSWSRAVYAREARLIERYERELGARAQELWALTEVDAQYYRGLTPRLVRVLPLPGGNGAVPQSYSKVFDVALIGNWCWRANRDGLDWFLHRVHPHLPKNLSIHVAGGGAQWLERRYPNVVYRGFVRDAQEFLAQARVVAIPTLSGGGIQIKTLDAIASGSQVVANPIAVRGIANAPSTVRVADDPAAFADALRIAAAQPDCAAATAEALHWTQRREQLLLDTIAHALQISACQLQSKAHPTHAARAQPCLPST